MCAFYMRLHEQLILDVAGSYGAHEKHESTLDIAKLRCRVRREGLSFLTKALPKLGKALDRALSQGTKFNAVGFCKRSRSTIPRLFGWLFDKVFSDQGDELSDASPRAVRDLRQILYWSYKLEVPFSADQEEETLRDFVEVDLGLPQVIHDDETIKHARNLITNVFGLFDPFDIIPRHGPGAVATGERNHEKHCFKRLYQQINETYPYTEYYHYSLGHVCDEPGYLESLEIHSAGIAKVVLVPKDSRGPRIISCEPLEYQWIQGGLGGALQRHLERNPWSSGHVNFTSQEVNRNLALLGSITKQWVTLDMKEASDRVSVALVQSLFSDCPLLLRCLMATRTPETKLPSGEVVRMNKFAPMGSNLCFPIESVCFFALAVGSIMAEYMKGRRPVKAAYSHTAYRNAMWKASRNIFVYGDDIIAKRADYALLLEYFPKVGLRFNTDKCCTQGHFRESCGMDAYKGVQVTPLRLKRLWAMSRKQSPEALLSYVALSNAAYFRGMHGVASLIQDAVHLVIGPIPVLCDGMMIGDMSPEQTPLERGMLVWVRPRWYVGPGLNLMRSFRYSRKLHRIEVRVLQARSRKITVNPDAWSMVLRRFTSPSEHTEPGAFALTRSITLKRVWVQGPPLMEVLDA